MQARCSTAICKCRKNGLTCTDLCKCNELCENRSNESDDHDQLVSFDNDDFDMF